MLYVIGLVVGFFASCAGSICGIGGGVLMKPILDLTGLVSVSQAGFYSGCTVLAMSLVSLYKRLKDTPDAINYKITTVLAVGAAIGGLAGKSGFDGVRSWLGDGTANNVQSISLFVLILGTLIYTLLEHKVKRRQITSQAVILAAGCMLGVLSSFLGLGGGPFNLIVLSYLFSMDTKTAGLNSIYIILFSQTTSLVQTLITGLPQVQVGVFLLMVCGGIAGGLTGSRLNRKMSVGQVRILLIILMVVIMGICVMNFV